jgi:hypothetical protein
MKTKVLILALALALSLLVAGVALANGGVERPRWVLGGGASDSAGGAALRATLGQPAVGVVTSGGGDIALGQGFWHGGAAQYRIYLPFVVRQYEGLIVRNDP